jgi:hypothetical protein
MAGAKLKPAQQAQKDYGQTFVSKLKALLGDPYVYGAAGPSSFDCSGLVQYALEQAGIKNVPRTSEAQWAWAEKINKSQLQPGDLVFSQWPGDNASPGHVQVYIGGGQVIQAPHTGANVSTAPLSADAGHIVGYGRIPATLALATTVGPPQPPGGGGGGGGPDITGLMSEAGTLLHGIAEILDFMFAFFAPGQGWRIAFAAGGAVAGYGAVKSYTSSEGPAGSAAFPLSVGLAAVATMCIFMAARPWPQEAGGSEKPGKYMAEILSGQPPPAGPARVHETPVIEAGLGVFAAAWVGSKAANVIGSITTAVSGLLTAIAARGAVP